MIEKHGIGRKFAKKQEILNKIVYGQSLFTVNNENEMCELKQIKEHFGVTVKIAD